MKSYWLRCASSAITTILRRWDSSGWVSPSRLGEEFLDRREDDASRFDGEFLPQIGAVLRLHRRLAQEVPAEGEGAEELVVEVVAVGQHDHGGVGHGRLADDAPGVEGHGQALARALGVPDDADPPVARRAARLPAAARLTGAMRHAGEFRRAQSLVDRGLHGVELVIARHLLDERAAAVILEHDEVADQREESLRRADALQHHLQLGRVRIGEGLPGDGAPGLEPLPSGGQRADPRRHSVRDHQDRVHGEQRRQLGLVGLKLIPGGSDRRVFVRRVLQLDHSKRQAVDEQHHVGAALALVLDDRELVDREPVVVGGIVEVDDANLRPTDGSAVRAVFDRHAVHQHAVEGAVAGFQRRTFGTGQLAEGVVPGRRGSSGLSRASASRSRRSSTTSP